MRKLNLLICILIVFIGCNNGADVRGIPGPAEVEAAAPKDIDLRDEVASLEDEGFEVSVYEVEEEKYIRQKYFLAFLKEGPNQDQDQTEAAEFQELHLNYLKKLAEEDYISLSGPAGDESSVKGIVLFNTPTLEMADSLARMDPMVKAGRLEVEIYPWWITKGGKLR